MGLVELGQRRGQLFEKLLGLSLRQVRAFGVGLWLFLALALGNDR